MDEMVKRTMMQSGRKGISLWRERRLSVGKEQQLLISGPSMTSSRAMICPKNV